MTIETRHILTSSHNFKQATKLLSKVTDNKSRDPLSANHIRARRRDVKTSWTTVVPPRFTWQSLNLSQKSSAHDVSTGFVLCHAPFPLQLLSRTDVCRVRFKPCIFYMFRLRHVIRNFVKQRTLLFIHIVSNYFFKY